MIKLKPLQARYSKAKGKEVLVWDKKSGVLAGTLTDFIGNHYRINVGKSILFCGEIENIEEFYEILR